jgi:hypothetical protein
MVIQPSVDEFHLDEDAIKLLGEDGGGRSIDDVGHGGNAPRLSMVYRHIFGVGTEEMQVDEINLK